MIKVSINGKEFKLFTSISINLNYDSVASGFSMDTSLTTEQIAQKAIPKPLSYAKIEVDILKPNNTFERILTGVITGHSTQSGSTPNGLRLSGYSRGGVLADCSPAQQSYPLQDDGKTLRQITEKLIKPFGMRLIVNPIVQVEADTPIAKATCEPSDVVAGYIAKLASQKNIILGHVSRGQLLFTKTRANEKPSSSYNEGDAQGELLSVGLETNGRAIHSIYTVLRQSTFTDNSNQNPEEKVSNTLVPIFRPQTKKQSSGEEDTTGNAAVNARMKGIKEAIKFQLTVSTLFYQNGQPIRPNRIVKIKAPSAFLNEPTELFVVSTNLEYNAFGSRAVLTCVLAESFTGRQARGVF